MNIINRRHSKLLGFFFFSFLIEQNVERIWVSGTIVYCLKFKINFLFKRWIRLDPSIGSSSHNQVIYKILELIFYSFQFTTLVPVLHEILRIRKIWSLFWSLPSTIPIKNPKKPKEKGKRRKIVTFAASCKLYGESGSHVFYLISKSYQPVWSHQIVHFFNTCKSCILPNLFLNHVSLCKAMKLCVSLTYVVNLGWWARSASRVDFSMFAGCKNAWKHSVTMAHQCAIISSNWGLPSVCIHYNGACLVCSSLWLSGIFLDGWIIDHMKKSFLFFFSFYVLIVKLSVLKFTM